MMSDTNPYAPPVASASAKADGKDASWYLNRVQKYYRRMGTAMLAYIGIVVVVAGVSKTTDGSLRVADIAGPLVWCALLTWLFAAMVRIGYVSHADFPAYYKRARWIGIIAGALFLPILGLPAFISVRRLTRYNTLTNG